VATSELTVGRSKSHDRREHHSTPVVARKQSRTLVFAITRSQRRRHGHKGKIEAPQAWG